jgi:hypothetical protein
VLALYLERSFLGVFLGSVLGIRLGRACLLRHFLGLRSSSSGNNEDNVAQTSQSDL